MEKKGSQNTNAMQTIDEYMSSACLLDMAQLENEPSRLANERQAILEEIKDRAYRNCDTFIRTIQCSKNVQQHYERLEDEVKRMQSDFRNTKLEASKFVKSAQAMSNARQKLSIAQEHQADLLKVLKIPVVIEECVRAGAHQEAFELIQFSSRLKTRLASIPAIEQIVGEIDRQHDFLLRSCLQRLKANLNLSQCFKFIGFLKRMNVYSESELRYQFLLCRDNWLQTTLDSNLPSKPDQQVSKIIEVYQEAIFDILVQYRAIFPTDNCQPLARVSDEIVPVRWPSLLSSWLNYRLQCFTERLAERLNQCSTERLDSIMTQCLYFGASLGRVGANFGQLVMPVFENYVLRIFEESLNCATHRFLNALSEENAFHPIKHLNYVLEDTASSLEDSCILLKPPSSFMAYPSLCHYYNGIVEAFDKVQSSLSVSLALPVISRLESCLDMVADALTCALEKSKSANLHNFIRCIESDLIDFLNLCLRQLFRVDQLDKAVMMGDQQERLKLKGTKLKQLLSNHANGNDVR